MYEGKHRHGAINWLFTNLQMNICVIHRIYVNVLQGLSFLSSPGEWQLSCIGSLHPTEHTVTATVLGRTEEVGCAIQKIRRFAIASVCCASTADWKLASSDT
jgi:hypothetical protein